MKDIYKFTFKYITDSQWNEGFTELDGRFIGTEKEFDQFCKEEEFGQGFGCWDVTKKEPTTEELEDYYWWKKEIGELD